MRDTDPDIMDIKIVYRDKNTVAYRNGYLRLEVPITPRYIEEMYGIKAKTFRDWCRSEFDHEKYSRWRMSSVEVDYLMDEHA